MKEQSFKNKLLESKIDNDKDHPTNHHRSTSPRKVESIRNSPSQLTKTRPDSIIRSREFVMSDSIQEQLKPREIHTSMTNKYQTPKKEIIFNNRR